MSAVLTPYTTGAATDLAQGTLWRKQVLKHGTISYGDRKIVFDRAMSTELAAAFKAGAYDQVPFVLATADNAHNSLPERCRGDIRALIPTDDGMDMVVQLSGDGAQIVADNPKLGVSLRIVEDLKQADGRTYPMAVEHVLGTLNPRLTGMRPWEQIELSNAPGPVLDLTQSPYDQEATMPELTEEELAGIRALLAKPITPPPTATTIPEETTLTDAEIENLIAGLMDETPAAPALAGVGAELSISAETRAALDMAQANDNARALELAAINAELDDERFKREAVELASVGIPPKIIELAKPLLMGKSRIIDLANGTKVDAGAVIRAVLAECKGTIDMSGEHGAAFPSAQQRPDEATGARDMVAEFKKQYSPTGGARS